MDIAIALIPDIEAVESMVPSASSHSGSVSIALGVVITLRALAQTNKEVAGALARKTNVLDFLVATIDCHR